MFADDTTLLTVGADVNLVKKVATKSLNQVVKWFKVNGFVINESKTQNVVYSLLKGNGNTNDDISLNYIKLLGMR